MLKVSKREFAILSGEKYLSDSDLEHRLDLLGEHRPYTKIRSDFGTCLITTCAKCGELYPCTEASRIIERLREEVYGY